MADSLREVEGSRQNRHRVLLMVSLLGVFLAVAVALGMRRAASWVVADDQPPAKAVAPRTRPAGRSPVAELMAAAPADLPALVRERYRLGPDRRLLLAVAEIQRLRTGAPPTPVQAKFQDGRWRILSGGNEVGTLSEFPTFEEGIDLLARWAGRLPQAPAAAPSGGGDTSGLERATRDVDAAALLKALSSLDAPRDETKVRAVASALAWLSTATLDRLDQADPLLAETWAWLALERPRDAGAETLAARALGYEAEAERASANLPADDPVRLYAAGDERRLGAVCAARPADRPFHFLRLALLAERDEAVPFRAALATSPWKEETSLTLRGLEARLSDFQTSFETSYALADAAMAPLLAPSEAPAEARTRDFEAAIDRLASHGAVDVAAVQAGYRAAFYSGLFGKASFLLDQYAGGPSASELAASFKEPAPGTAEELRRWIEVRSQVLQGSRDVRPMVELLEASRAIGAEPLFVLGTTLGKQVGSTDPSRRQPMPELFARLDTRPSHRAMAARLAEGNLMSPGLLETFARAAAEAAPHLNAELSARVATMREDAARLREIAGDPRMPRSTRMAALDMLGKLGRIDDAFIRARYEAMAAESDSGTSALVDFLEKRGDLRGSIAAVEAAIRRGSSYPNALGPAALRTTKARLQLASGDPDGASATLQPALDVGMEETLLEGARIELARNRPESALSLAQSSLARYPERASETSGLIAQARWRLNDYATAARELAASRNGIVDEWNRYLPEGFAETFAAAPEDSVRRAFSELQAAGIKPRVLAAVAVALGKKRGLEIALPLLEGLHDPAPEWRDYIRLSTYDLVREKSGDAAALAWIRGVFPQPPKAFSMTLYQMHRYDLLLGLYPDGQESEDPHLVRMLKAASLLHLRETHGPRWEGLVAEVGADTSDDLFVRCTRYFLGRAEAATVLQPLPGPGHLTTLGWVMGVKAASERRFADADQWFQVALESGQQNQPPHAWSWTIESDWHSAYRSLSVLEKTGKF